MAIQQCVDTNLFGKVCDYCDGGAMYKVLAECVEIITYAIGAAAIIGIIICGIMYITSGGDVAHQTKAKQRLYQTVVGILCYGIFFTFMEFIIPGGVIGSTTDNTTTSCPAKVETPATTADTVKPKDQSDPKTKDDPASEYNNDDDSSSKNKGKIEHGTRPFTMCGTEYDVIKIQVDGVPDDGTNSTGLKKFIRNKIQKYHINQSDNRVYDLDGTYINSTAQNGHCDVVSVNLAYDMYFDTITADSCSAGGKGRKSGFTTVSGDKGFKKAYDAIMAGKPVVHRVTINHGSLSTAERHYAVIVGIRKGADRNNLSTRDFLFLETWGNGVLWNNDNTRLGGWKTNAGGSGCIKDTRTNRFPYDTYFFIPTSKSGPDRKEC